MIVEIIFIVVTIYLVCGLIFTIPFVIKGVSDIDEGARGSSSGFRIIIIPGTIVFWPFLLKKWIGIKSKSRDKTA